MKKKRENVIWVETTQKRLFLSFFHLTFWINMLLFKWLNGVEWILFQKNIKNFENALLFLVFRTFFLCFFLIYSFLSYFNSSHILSQGFVEGLQELRIELNNYHASSFQATDFSMFMDHDMSPATWTNAEKCHLPPGLTFTILCKTSAILELMVWILFYLKRWLFQRYHNPL